MTEDEIQRMIAAKTLQLTKEQLFWHYSIVYFLLFVPLLTSINLFKYYITHTYAGRPIEDLMFPGYVWILPAILFYFIQKKRLKFKVINVSVTNDLFHKAVKQTSKELEWEIVKSSHKIVIAKSGFSYRSLVEQVTIIWCEDKILFNSICDPDNRPSVTSLGMNKVNRMVFEGILIKKSS